MRVDANLTRFVDWCVNLAKETVVGRPEPFLTAGAGGYTDWVLLTILCLKEKKGETYRSVVGLFRHMPRLRGLPDLSLGRLPGPSTVYKVMDRLPMGFFRSLLQQTTTLPGLRKVAAIDVSSFDRVAASRRSAIRIDYRF